MSAAVLDTKALRLQASALLRQGSSESALAILSGLAEAEPSPQAYRTLVNALIEAGRAGEALDRAFQAIRLAPVSWMAQDSLGRALAANGEYASAVQAFRESARLRQIPSSNADPVTVPAHYLVHQLEQIDYLRRVSMVHLELLNRLTREQHATLHTQLSGMIAGSHDDPPFVSVSGADADALLSLPAYAPEQEPIGQQPLNPAIDFERVESSLLSREPRFITLDDFLSDQALHSVRRFCLESTAWRRPYRYGYVGAFPEDGFASVLIFQIAEALRRAMPAVLGQLYLSQWWAFAYDARLPGTDIHGDDSEISLNLWITPTEANLDPEHGGLVIWDRSAPEDWSFDEYNSGGEKVRNWLERMGARSTVIPHRQNRAILFHGHLFHRSDGTRFAPGFEQRRRNLTLLFRRAR